MKETWFQVVKPVALANPSLYFGVWGPTEDKFRKHGDGEFYFDSYGIRKYVTETVLDVLLAERLKDVLCGFDANGQSFIGWIINAWRTKDVAWMWLRALSRVTDTPCVFAMNDHIPEAGWVDHPFTAHTVLITFQAESWVPAMRTAISGGVSLGTPDSPETLKCFLRPFRFAMTGLRKRYCDAELLREVLQEVLKAPAERLHWTFVDLKPFKSDPKYTWAVKTMKWFQLRLEIKLEVANEVARTNRTRLVEVEKL